MADNEPLFRKGSLIPAVLTLESDYIERIEQAHTDAKRIVAEARDNAEQLLAETKRRLPRIAAKHRDELIAQAHGDTSALERDHAASINSLHECIERNHKRVLDTIIGRIIPQPDNRKLS